MYVDESNGEALSLLQRAKEQAEGNDQVDKHLEGICRHSNDEDSQQEQAGNRCRTDIRQDHDFVERRREPVVAFRAPLSEIVALGKERAAVAAGALSSQSAPQRQTDPVPGARSHLEEHTR